MDRHNRPVTARVTVSSWALVVAAIGTAIVSAPAGLGAAPIARSLSWEGSGEVYPPGETIALTIRSRIDAAGNVDSESWPTALGREKGLHRLILSSSGDRLQIGSETRDVPAALAAEERMQFGFYHQLQEAALRAPAIARAGANTFSVDGPTRTWFRLDSSGAIVAAENRLPGEQPGTEIRQQFRFVGGFWNDGDAVFPKHMEMLRDGERFFTLDVTKFDAG